MCSPVVRHELDEAADRVGVLLGFFFFCVLHDRPLHPAAHSYNGPSLRVHLLTFLKECPAEAGLVGWLVSYRVEARRRKYRRLSDRRH